MALVHGQDAAGTARLATLRARFADNFFELVTEPGYVNEAEYDMNSVVTAQRGGRIAYGLQVHDRFVRLAQELRYSPLQIELLAFDYFFDLPPGTDF